MALKIWLGTTSSDPTTAANWSPSGQPTATDDVVLTGSNPIAGGVLSASGNLASFVARDFSGSIGSEGNDLIVDLAASSLVSISTLAKAHLDFNASDVDVNIYATRAAVGNDMGLHLKGSGANSLNAYGNSAVLLLESLDNDINTFSDSVIVVTAPGANVVNFTGPGKLVAYGDVTNIYATGQTVDYHGGAPTTLQAESGATINHWSNVNVTNANGFGGTVNLKDQNTARAVTNTAVRAGGQIHMGNNWTPTNPPPGGTYTIQAA